MGIWEDWSLPSELKKGIQAPSALCWAAGCPLAYTKQK